MQECGQWTVTGKEPLLTHTGRGVSLTPRGAPPHHVLADRLASLHVPPHNVPPVDHQCLAPARWTRSARRLSRPPCTRCTGDSAASPTRSTYSRASSGASSRRAQAHAHGHDPAHADVGVRAVHHVRGDRGPQLGLPWALARRVGGAGRSGVSCVECAVVDRRLCACLFLASITIAADGCALVSYRAAAARLHCDRSLHVHS